MIDNHQLNRKSPLRIDSHQHFWKRTHGYYNWLTEDMDKIFRDFEPKDLADHLKQTGVSKTVLIQAAADIKETEYLLSIAESTEFVAGVVGWVDMLSPNAVHEIARLSRNPYFKGIRPMIQDITDAEWILKPELNSVFSCLSNLGLSFDALVKPRHLKPLIQLLYRHPQLKVAIDHAAKPNIVAKNFDSWSHDMQMIARQTNAICKLSGLVTEAGNNPNFENLSPYMLHILKCFGPNRIMWGSDWPVLNLATDYRQWVGMTEALLEPLGDEAREAIWSKTAKQFYKL